MSEYLARRLEKTENIHLRSESEKTAINGDGSRVRVLQMTTSELEIMILKMPFLFLFFFIGAKPCSDCVR